MEPPRPIQRCLEAVRRAPRLEQFGSDLRHSARRFRREPGFVLLVLLLLAIGIGINTAVFSFVNTVVLRPLPFANANRLVWIANHRTRDWSGYTSRIDTWEGLRETNRTLESLEAYYPFSSLRTSRLATAGEPESVVGYGVSPGLFGMLGIVPVRGRAFAAEDVVTNAPARVVLSDQFWRRDFNADPRIVGRIIRIDEQPSEVIGVLPARDGFAEVFSPAARIDYYWPIRNDVLRPSGNTVALIGRLRPGITPAQAQVDLSLAIDQIKARHPEWGKWYWANSTPLKDYIVGELRSPLWFLWAAAGIAFAIVVFNVGGLLLAHSFARREEFAVRLALGANRGRIIRLLLVECLALVTGGAVLGAGVAAALVRGLALRSAVEIPLLQDVRLDRWALAMVVLAGGVTLLVAGLLPAWQITRRLDLQSSLKGTGRGADAGASRARLRAGLVVIEVALACVLVVCGSLMVRSFEQLLRVDLGFSPDHVLAVRVDALVPEARGAAYFDALLDRVRAVPGVAAAALTDCIPVERDRSWGAYPVDAENPKDQRWTGAHVRIVSPDSFAAMGTRIIAGRDFARSDGADSDRVVVVNRTMAKLFWPGRNAVGQFIGMTYTDGKPSRVIGVVEDVRHAGPAVPADNEMYLSAPQFPWENSFDLLVRSSVPAAVITPDLRRAFHDADPTLPFTMVRPLSTIIDRTTSSPRLLVSIVAGFALLALALAALGLYGIVSYSVTQRTKEIGIRMALGADGARVQREVVIATLRLAGWGIGLGCVGALAAGRLIRTILFGVTPNDPLAYGIMAAALLACALVAGFFPARRASRVDPMVALRIE